jgi:hypothetical protein
MSLIPMDMTRFTRPRSPRARNALRWQRAEYVDLLAIHSLDRFLGDLAISVYKR